MDWRQYDPAISRWTVMDLVMHHDFSPYSAFDNNPAFWSDPSGANSVKYNWGSGGYDVLDKDGKVVGSFDPGMLGNYLPAIVESINLFFSLNPNDDENSGGGENGNGKSSGGDDNGKKRSKRKYNSYMDYFQKEGRHKFQNNFTFEEAIFHYNFGKGESVTVNLNTLNFEGITVERFLKSENFHERIYHKITVNFLGSDYQGHRREQGLIYGSVTLVYIGDNTIMALPDQYNFEIHKGDVMTMRNFLTTLGGMFNGYGAPYYINFQGTAKIKAK